MSINNTLLNTFVCVGHFVGVTQNSVKSKGDLIKRLKCSPDCGDAVVYCANARAVFFLR